MSNAVQSMRAKRNSAPCAKHNVPACDHASNDASIVFQPPNDRCPSSNFLRLHLLSQNLRRLQPRQHQLRRRLRKRRRRRRQRQQQQQQPPQRQRPRPPLPTLRLQRLDLSLPYHEQQPSRRRSHQPNLSPSTHHPNPSQPRPHAARSARVRKQRATTRRTPPSTSQSPRSVLALQRPLPSSPPRPPKPLRQQQDPHVPHRDRERAPRRISCRLRTATPVQSRPLAASGKSRIFDEDDWSA